MFQNNAKKYHIGINTEEVCSFQIVSQSKKILKYGKLIAIYARNGQSICPPTETPTQKMTLDVRLLGNRGSPRVGKIENDWNLVEI